jgi:hypothetical protein
MGYADIDAVPTPDGGMVLEYLEKEFKKVTA